MSHVQFDKIITEFTYTNELLPFFVYKFWEATQIIRTWKDLTKENFVPSWVICFD